MNIDELQLNLGRELAIAFFHEYRKTEEFDSLLVKDLTFQELKTTIVLNIYEKVENMYLVKELGKLEKMDKSMLIAQIFQLLQDVNSHEKSWYSNLREEENERKLDSVTNNYYGMVPSEKINLLEAIEKVIENEMEGVV
ncbi:MULTISPECIES: hypothetical protein [Enterococcus]|uniref:hypothetical protein n=1 Tax=Enterococcus TaxID=1350 RepID=UPI0015C561E4|nr:MULTISPECIES: hypothetical protein [Enterococcus]MDK4449767.1 hypothetical protein [Enterococcus casseliflavus]MDY2549275.1 hypothetical protein [Enterococcus casseliflavus]NQE02705.1 hypothetical protein [Enterococcus gallinarum]